VRYGVRLGHKERQITSAVSKFDSMGKLNSMRLSDIDDFDTGGRARLLETIDSLRELGISESVSLPQVTRHSLTHWALFC
jgi:hypothetical protein